MSERLSVYRDENVAKLIGSFTSSDVSEIMKIFKNVIFQTNEVLEQFSKDEWMALVEAFNGHLWEPDILNAGTCLAMGVVECDQYEGLGEKWKIDVIALSKKLQRLDYLEACSVFITIKYFWKNGSMRKNWWSIKERMTAKSKKDASANS